MTGKDDKLPIGIYLGAGYSCVGVWYEARNRVEIIPNCQGETTTPSFVAFTPTGCLIGNGAKNQVTLNPTNTIFDVTKLLGRRFNDPEVQESIQSWPFVVKEGTNGLPNVVVILEGKEKEYSAEKISSMVLLDLKASAESYIGGTVKDAVITVPAYFNDSQLQSTKVAAYLAGLNVLQIIHKPIAAAIAYGLHEKAIDTNVLVFDLDDNTFDVSLVTIKEMGKFTVKAKDGDTHFGGQEIVNIMVDHFVKEFKSRNHRMDVTLNFKALGRLRILSERAIRYLISNTQTRIDMDCLYNGIDFSTSITRSKFEYINESFFSKCIETLESLLTDAKINKIYVDHIVLVGWWTMIPKVQQLLREFFDGKVLLEGINVEEVVAYGAAIHAANVIREKNEKAKTLPSLPNVDIVPLSPGADTRDGTAIHVADLIRKKGEKSKTLPLLDIVPLSLGVDAHDGVFSVIIPRNTPIPAEKEQIYFTTVDNQITIPFNVYQGERSRAKDNKWLGKFEVAVSPAPKGKSKVKVVFSVEADGSLNCWVKEFTTGLKRKIIIDNDKGKLSEEEIAEMLKDAENYKLEDREYKKIMRVRNVLEEYIYNVKRKMKTIGSTDKTRLHAEEIKKMENAIEDANQYVDGNHELADVDEYQNVIDQLEKLCVGVIAQLV